MDTITSDVLRKVADQLGEQYPQSVVHTVTVTLSGHHGGVDCTVEGSNPDGADITRTIAVH